ncbi:MAG: hypothetical protein AB7H97_07325 [Pseudobdellovibrionaceae bacterium]
MDLIELKSAWTLLQQNVISQDKVDESQILNSVHGKSKSEISKIERGLRSKFIIASLAIIVAIGLAVTSFTNPSFNPLDFIFAPVESATFFSIMALSIGVMVCFNYQAYKQIENIQHSSLSLKDNLQSFIKAMNRAIAFNIFSDAFMTPIIFAWVFYAYAFEEHDLGIDFRTALLFVLPILIGLLSYFFQRFMQRLKFGRYLDRLISDLDSLQKKSSEL